jgi:hypothetical protein
MLFLYYFHIRDITDASIVSFFKLIYVFCGGMAPSDNFSLHLLNSPDEFSIFLYRISEEELEWILMSLYYIYIHKKQLKFEVVSALTLIRKKCGNECKFRLTDIAQSLLHLLEN